MSETLLIIDSGTSTTRVRAFDGRRVLAHAVRPVRARDNAMAGHTGPLRTALRELVDLAVPMGAADIYRQREGISSGIQA